MDAADTGTLSNPRHSVEHEQRPCEKQTRPPNTPTGGLGVRCTTGRGRSRAPYTDQTKRPCHDDFWRSWRGRPWKRSKIMSMTICSSGAQRAQRQLVARMDVRNVCGARAIANHLHDYDEFLLISGRAECTTADLRVSESPEAGAQRCRRRDKLITSQQKSRTRNVARHMNCN